MPKVKLSYEDLVRMLRRQMRYLDLSCAGFDAGDEDEAARIAVVLRVLLHDTTRSTSLLTQLGVKNKVDYLDTVSPVGIGPSVLVTTPDGETVEIPGPSGLANWNPTAFPPRWFAPLRHARGDAARDFASWWKAAVITGPNDEPNISRWDLVDWMAHQDGGAHVDPRGVDARYARYLLEGDGSRWVAGDAIGGQVSLDAMSAISGNAAACSVRQIGFELKKSLQTSGAVSPLL